MIYFHSFFEFQLYYFPSLSDSVIADYLGMETWEVRLDLGLRAISREFSRLRQRMTDNITRQAAYTPPGTK